MCLLKISLMTLATLSFIDTNFCLASSHGACISGRYNISDFSPEAQKYAIEKYCFEITDYLVNKNIKSYAKNTVGNNYWALKAIKNELINGSDKTACKWAESIKNLKTLCVLMSSDDYIDGNKFLDGLITKACSLLTEDSNDLKSRVSIEKMALPGRKEKVLSLLTTAVIAESVKVFFSDVKRTGKIARIDRDDIETLNNLYDRAFEKFFSRFKKVVDNFCGGGQGIFEVIYTGVFGSVTSPSIAPEGFLHNSLCRYLRHDWDCYLVQFGTICGIPYRASVAVCAETLRDSYKSLASKYETIFGRRSTNQEFVEDAFEILQFTKDNPQFANDWSNAQKSITNKFTDNSPYNSVYLWYVDNWYDLQNVLKTKHIDTGIFNLILRYLPRYESCRLKYADAINDTDGENYRLSEGRSLRDFIGNVADAISTEKIDQAWFDSLIDKIEGMCHVMSLIFNDLYDPWFYSYDVTEYACVLQYYNVNVGDFYDTLNSFRLFRKLDDRGSEIPYYKVAQLCKNCEGLFYFVLIMTRLRVSKLTAWIDAEDMVLWYKDILEIKALDKNAKLPVLDAIVNHVYEICVQASKNTSTRTANLGLRMWNYINDLASSITTTL